MFLQIYQDYNRKANKKNVFYRLVFKKNYYICDN